MAPTLIKEELKQRLDPFVQVLLDSFKTYYNPIVVTTLHVLTQIIHLGLPMFNQLLKRFLARIFKLFSLSNNSDAEFLSSMFKCTSELIKTYAVYQDLSETQVKTLVLIIKTNLNSHST